ncbi:hypothetical protein ACFLV0_04610 [Chloroflexota bacterium]
MADFPRDMVDGENKKYNQHRAELLRPIAEVEARTTQAQQIQIGLDNVENYCQIARRNLATCTYEDKRLALAALQVEIWLDGDKVLLKGIIPKPELSIPSTLLEVNKRITRKGLFPRLFNEAGSYHPGFSNICSRIIKTQSLLISQYFLYTGIVSSA